MVQEHLPIKVPPGRLLKECERRCEVVERFWSLSHLRPRTATLFSSRTAIHFRLRTNILQLHLILTRACSGWALFPNSWSLNSLGGDTAKLLYMRSPSDLSLPGCVEMLTEMIDDSNF